MRGKAWAFLGGAGLGALAMYFLDPRSGNTRRAVARDKFISTGRRTGVALEGRARDVANRARGAVASARSRVRGGEQPDHVLVQRVRAALGRVIAHAQQVDVTALNGIVTLKGTVDEDKSRALNIAVRAVRGVKDVVDSTVTGEREVVG
ncbi:MAG: BON domain-containing protein [Gemmatimonadota bacterium]